MTVKERLTEFLNYRRIGQAKFSSIAGLSRGYVNNIVNTIGPEAQPKIATAFPDLNMAWLLTGKGEMLKDEANTNQTDMDYSNLFKTIIEQKDRQIEELMDQNSRLIGVIERMHNVYPEGTRIPPHTSVGKSVK